MPQLSIKPFLMFQGEGSAALDFYTSVFPESSVNSIERYGPNELGPEGSIKKALFTIGGQSVLCTDSFIKHPFSFTPSFSFFVECPSDTEVFRLSAILKDGGQELMPAGNYGFSRMFSWVNDPYGVSWQLNFA